MRIGHFSSVLLVVLGLVVAACSPTDSPNAGAENSTTTTTLTSPEPAVTTTTVAAPAVVPLGDRWDEVGAVAAADKGGNVHTNTQRLLSLDDDIFLLNALYNTSVVTRSRDDGVTWETVSVAAPPTSGTMFLTDLVVGMNGRLVAIGSIGSRCRSDADLGNGYRQVELCQRFQPVLFLSDDDGASWRQIEPAGMAVPGDSSVIVSEMAATDDGFLAIGTVKGPDWHARVWSSPDGETWTLEQEMRDIDGGPMSGRQLLTDGDSLVVVTDGHPCGKPAESPSGWVLGSSWLSRMRLYSGTDVADLSMLTPVDHPFANDAEPVDCDALTSVFDVEDSDENFVRASGAVIGGVITMLKRLDPFDEEEEDDTTIDQTTSGSRVFTQLIDGEWVATEIDGVLSQNRVSAGGSSLIDVDGVPGMFEYESTRSGPNFVPILPDGDGSWYQSTPDRPAFTSAGGGSASGVASNGALIAATAAHSDPFRTDFGPADVATMTVWRSVETTGDRIDQCDLEPGGTCRYTDLSTIDGYPDFSGIDLSGADLAFSNLGEANFTGANFADAKLWATTSDDGSMFDGANFTDARLETAHLGSAVGADFTGANVYGATIEDVTDAVFVGANLQSAGLAFVTLPQLDTALLRGARLEQIPPLDPQAPYEISLVDLDLSLVSIRNGFDAPLLRVVSMDGSTFYFTSLNGVDLTTIDPVAVDLADVRVSEDSLCPDGSPPDDPPLGTCIRTDTSP